MEGKDDSVPTEIITQYMFLIFFDTSFICTPISSSQTSQQINPLISNGFAVTLTDNDSSTLNEALFTFKWQCINTDTKQLCKDPNGQSLAFQNQISIGILPQTLPFNYNYKIVLTVTRNINIYSTQIYTLAQSTAKAVLQLLSTPQTSLYYSDQMLIELSYSNTLYSYQGLNNYTVNLQDTLGVSQQIISPSPKITFMVYDYYPNIDLATDNKVSLSFSFFDGTLLDSYSDSSLNYQIIFNSPPTGCQVNLSSQSSFTNNIISLKNCVSNSQSYNYQFFYYSNINQQQQEIKSSGNTITRKMLSVTQSSNSITSSLPPGNLVVMIVLSQNNRVVSNFTLSTTILENNFNSASYEAYLNSQYAQAQQYQQNNNPESEIFVYEAIIDAIEYFEPKNPLYKQSSNINSLKLSIIQRLGSTLWQSQSNDVYLLSAQINLRIKNTQITITQNASQSLKQQNLNNIDFTLNSIQNSTPPLTTDQRSYFQACLSTTYQDLVKNMNNINQWSPTNNQDAITTSTNVINGISNTMLINQQPIIVSSDGVILQVEKLDYIKFMQTYYPDQDVSLQYPNASLTYYISTQTWSSSHPIFRDELTPLTEQYISNTTNTTIIELLQKTYPVIVPQVLTDNSKTRRILIQNQADLQIPFKIGFGVISQAERITCIQKSSATGKWVSNSCKVFEEIINSERHVSCSCQTPTVTSLIADVAELFNNQNVRDIFSSTGFWRVFTLSNWYEYAPIWTIIALNIGFVILMVIGYKLDKKDRQNDLKKYFLYHKKPLGENEQIQENIFMKVKNQKIQTQTMKKNNKGEDIINEKISEDKSIIRHAQRVNEEVNIDFDPVQQEQNREQLNHTPLQMSYKQESQVITQNNNLLDQESEKFQRKDEEINQIKVLEKDIFCLDSKEIEEGVQPFQVAIKYPQLISKGMINELNKNEQREQIQQSELKQETNQNNIKIYQNYEKYKTVYQTYEEEDVEVMSEGFNNNLNKDLEKKSQLSVQIPNQDQIKQFNDDPGITFRQSDPETSQNHQIRIDIESIQKKERESITENEEIGFNHNQMNLKDEEPYQNHQIRIENESIQKKEKEQIAEDEEIRYNNNQTGQKEVEVQQEILDPMVKQTCTNAQKSFLFGEQHQNIEEKATNQTLLVQQIPLKLSKEEILKFEKDRIEKENERKFEKTKMKLREYLKLENIIKATFSFHIFLSTFIIYNTRFSRILRFLIYYNKLVWNLAINSVFGINLSIVQTIILSIITAIALQIITTILTILCRYQKLLPIVLTVTTLFDLFCYYSVLVVVSGQNYQDSNIWIGKYFLNILLQEFVIGLAISFGMYYVCKRFFDKLCIPILFDILGAGLLIQGLQN